MSTISNKFFIKTIDDGSTLHGNLSVKGSLSQAWNGSSCVPDWKVAANQPTVFLTLLNGNTLTLPKEDFKWLYNNVEITFNSSGLSTNPAGLFQKTTESVTVERVTLSMPALKIVGNLASSSIVDVDTIAFSGAIDADGADVPFQANVQVRITKMEAGGYFGVVNFLNGKADITTKNETLTMWGELWGGENGGTVSNFTTKWYLNSSSTGIDGSTISGHTNAYSVSESSVVDYATVRCDFLVGGVVKYTAYVGIDDMQDPEFMYVQVNNANGNAANLHSGQEAEFLIWVGKRDNAAVDTAWTTFKVQLLDAEGQVIMTSSIPNVHNADANGWRTLPVYDSGDNINKAHIKFTYAVVKQYGLANMTGLILAQTAS